MGGGNLSRGFAISGVLYPILILVVFIIVQMLTMLGTRKMVLDQNRKQLIDSLNSNGKVYTNEELTTLITNLQNSSYSKSEVDNLIKSVKSEFEQTIDLRSGYNENTWYPVYTTAQAGKYHRMRCLTFLGGGGKPSWSTHPSGFSTSVDLLTQIGGWGAIAARTIVLANDQFWVSDGKTAVGYRNFGEASASIFYLRGGGRYILYSDYEANWKIVTSKYVFNEQYNIFIEPTTSYPGFIATNGIVDLTK